LNEPGALVDMVWATLTLIPILRQAEQGAA